MKIEHSEQDSSSLSEIHENPENIVTIETNQVPVVGSNNVVTHSNVARTNQIDLYSFQQQQVSSIFISYIFLELLNWFCNIKIVDKKIY